MDCERYVSPASVRVRKNPPTKNSVSALSPFALTKYHRRPWKRGDRCCSGMWSILVSDSERPTFRRTLRSCSERRSTMIVLALEAPGYRKLPFAEHRTFAKRSHVKDRKGFDMTYFGSTRVVDQASAHSLPRIFTVAGRP